MIKKRHKRLNSSIVEFLRFTLLLYAILYAAFVCLDSFSQPCPEVVMVDKSGLGWSERDLRSKARAEVGCPEKYGPRYCLKVFIKKRKHTFWAICGRVDEDIQ